jgi:uncharacterized protein (DUF488 family)
VTLYTVGHSTRPLDAFLALLAREGVRHVADVRRFPVSRRYPHFSREPLASALAARGVGYSHHLALGGRRTPRPDSPNAAWRNAGFRGYADYMQSADFAAALDALLALARATPTAILCAEAVPWRCHRSLIADAVVARGETVLHILDAGTTAHALPPFAVARGGQVTYPAPDGTAASGRLL